MPVKSSLYLSFDGKHSSQFGIINVTINSGLYEEQFMGEIITRKTKIRGNNKYYFHNNDREPYTFSLTLAFEGEVDAITRREVARWLSVDYYKELWFSDDPNRIFMAQPIGTPVLHHNGRQGYIDIEFECDAPWSYSPVYETQYDFSNNPDDGTVFVFDNRGDLPLLPEIEITKIGNGDFEIINLSNGGLSFKFTNLLDQEVIYIDNLNEYIASDISTKPRYDDFSYNFLELVYGVNQLRVIGDVVIDFRYRYRTLN